MKLPTLTHLRYGKHRSYFAESQKKSDAKAALNTIVWLFHNRQVDDSGRSKLNLRDNFN